MAAAINRTATTAGERKIPEPMSRLQPPFLPMTLKEAAKFGIGEFDIILVTGDAYVDHPSFGTALIGRVLWDAGFSVGVIAQPDWRSPGDLAKLGKPRLFFAISSGNVDSMVNNYTPALKRRNDDVYSPGGKGMGRPDRATTVYTDRLHALFPGTPLVIGGIEASLRRFAHYDYWSDSVRHAILADAPADLLVFGMAEKQVTGIAEALSHGEPVGSIRTIPGTSYRMPLSEWRCMDHDAYVVLPSFTEVSTDKMAYARSFSLHHCEQDPFRGKTVAQVHPKTVIIQNPPAQPLVPDKLDHIYELPFSRKQHPSYREPVPALEPVRFSVTSHRGCFGGCSFCALTHHQGRIVQSRSAGSIIREVRSLVRMPGFSGIVQDVGGPTANMYGASCVSWNSTGTCTDRNCTHCNNLTSAHGDQVNLLRQLRGIPGVKRVFISSGIRYDLFDKDDCGYLKEIVTFHTSGHLKVAPEHIVGHVTDLMNKPGKESFENFYRKFESLREISGKEQYILPYFMSGHPGCRMEDMVSLVLYLREHSLYTEQVQDFTPTPMSISTCMYYTGLDPFTMKPVYVPKGREKQLQRAMLHYRDQEKQELVREGLTMSGRTDLIGPGKTCLVGAAYGRTSLKRGPQRYLGSSSGIKRTGGPSTTKEPSDVKKKRG
jgi:uncharacterized radical SAM protein YgiQ